MNWASLANIKQSQEWLSAGCELQSLGRGGGGNFVEARLRLCFFGIETAFPVKKNLLNIMLFIVIPIQDTEHRNDI